MQFKHIQGPEINKIHSRWSILLWRTEVFWDRDQSISPGNDYSFVKKAVISPKWINWQHATTQKKNRFWSKGTHCMGHRKAKIKRVGLGLVEFCFSKFKAQKSGIVKQFWESWSTTLGKPHTQVCPDNFVQLFFSSSMNKDLQLAWNAWVLTWLPHRQNKPTQQMTQHHGANCRSKMPIV